MPFMAFILYLAAKVRCAAGSAGKGGHCDIAKPALSSGRRFSPESEFSDCHFAQFLSCLADK
jgi:hypothetical protein